MVRSGSLDPITLESRTYRRSRIHDETIVTNDLGSCPYGQGLRESSTIKGETSLTAELNDSSAHSVLRSAPLHGVVGRGASCHTRATRGGQ